MIGVEAVEESLKLGDFVFQYETIMRESSLSLFQNSFEETKSSGEEVSDRKRKRKGNGGTDTKRKRKGGNDYGSGIDTEFRMDDDKDDDGSNETLQILSEVIIERKTYSDLIESSAVSGRTGGTWYYELNYCCILHIYSTAL